MNTASSSSSSSYSDRLGKLGMGGVGACMVPGALPGRRYAGGTPEGGISGHPPAYGSHDATAMSDLSEPLEPPSSRTWSVPASEEGGGGTSRSHNDLRDAPSSSPDDDASVGSSASKAGTTTRVLVQPGGSDQDDDSVQVATAETVREATAKGQRKSPPRMGSPAGDPNLTPGESLSRGPLRGGGGDEPPPVSSALRKLGGVLLTAPDSWIDDGQLLFSDAPKQCTTARIIITKPHLTLVFSLHKPFFYIQPIKLAMWLTHVSISSCPPSLLSLSRCPCQSRTPPSTPGGSLPQADHRTPQSYPSYPSATLKAHNEATIRV